MNTNLQIEVVEITPYLLYFYWGRHPDHHMLDMRLGGGSFAIHKGQSAVVIDTMNIVGQGAWVRQYLENVHGIKHFTLVSSHWHVDHVIDNAVYADSTIIGHKRTREVMLAKKKTFEAGRYGNYGAFEVVPPNVVFEGELELWLADIQLLLQEYLVHEEGHLGIYLPADKIFIANDILEDPLWFFDFSFASATTQLAELERLKQQDIEIILPCHGTLDVIRNGGYDKQLIQANIDYLQSMLADLDHPDFATKTAPDYLSKPLENGTIQWCDAYTEVHALNRKMLLQRTHS